LFFADHLYLTETASCVIIAFQSSKDALGEFTAKAWHVLRRCFCCGVHSNHHLPMGGRGIAMSSRVTGTVEWFDGSKGFGYIQADGLGQVFVHYLAITDNGIRHLRAGEQVEFSVKESPRGPEAVELVRL
jgi:CspA family cold shock protein